MSTLLITDTHFGVRQNSNTWYKSQIHFIENQVIPSIKEYNINHIIHLGDVFDSRSSISTYIMQGVYNIFKKLSGLVDKIDIIAGNHDYYSPNSDEICILNILFSSIKNINIHSKFEYIDNQNLYIPWYRWEDKKNQNNIYNLINKYNIQNIFTHADIFDPTNIEFIKKIPCKIFSGHIHTPKIKNNLYNLGSCYPLTFSDCNSQRGIYIIDDKNIKFIPNESSIKFWRVYNDEIFNENEWRYNDYIEIYINQDYLLKDKYSSKIEQYLNQYKNINIIPQDTSIQLEHIEFNNYDILDITKSMIPEELRSKYNQILSRISPSV